LRQEIRDRELGEADFTVDLNKVIFGVSGGPLFAALLMSLAFPVGWNWPFGTIYVGGPLFQKAGRRDDLI
jgi:hypothetical protein